MRKDVDALCCAGVDDMGGLLAQWESKHTARILSRPVITRNIQRNGDTSNV